LKVGILVNNFISGSAIAGLLILTAWGGGSGGNGSTFFSTPNGSGEFNTNFENNIRNGGLIDGDGDGFAYEFGSNGTDGFRATAGIISGTDFGQAPTSGTVTYSGAYRLIEAYNITETSTTFSATSLQRGGGILVDADFTNGTLTGASGDLSIEGQITGNELSGTVTFDGIEGPLRGGIDEDQTVGAFHGNEGDRLFAGGFIADR
jgi:hypothetical protein